MINTNYLANMDRLTPVTIVVHFKKGYYLDEVRHQVADFFKRQVLYAPTLLGVNKDMDSSLVKSAYYEVYFKDAFLFEFLPTIESFNISKAKIPKVNAESSSIL